MDSSSHYCYCPIYGKLMLLLCFGLILPAANQGSPNFNDLVYKKCSNQTSTYPTLPSSSIISSLLRELILQSSKSKFFETITGDENTSISGRFQCRGDLSYDECYNCVNGLPKISNTLCGDTVPVRVQLSGCYIHYEADEPESSYRLELLHKTCSKSTAMWSGFQEVRDAAFAELESCVSGGNGFCDMSYESMRVTAQCEGKLGGCDCVQCIGSAAQMAEEECGYSVSGQVYLENCFVSYNYYSSGMPGSSNPERGTGGNSVKVVAIAVGGIAALSLVLVCWYFIRSGRKKSDDW